MYNTGEYNFQNIVETINSISFYTRNMTLPSSWQIEVPNILTSPDERINVAKQRERIEEKIKCLRKLYTELEITDLEYELEKRRLEVTLASCNVPKEDETVRASEKLKNMLAIMIEAIYCDTRLKKIIALKPRGIFLPLFALCDSLKEKDGLVFPSDFLNIGDPDGIRTHDLHRDRVAC
jgi:ribosome-associated translation inhibitor RaiA